MPPKPAKPHFLTRLAHGYLRGYHRVAAAASCTLPPTGAAILVCNHISGLDPVVLQSQCARRIVWMMAREYYDIPGLKWFYKAIEAIPVERSGRDLSSTRAALRALESGQILGIFPEGRIETTGGIEPFQVGASLLALRGGAAVYPAALEGTTRGKEMDEVFMYPQRIRVSFGPPIEFDRNRSDRPGINDATRRMQDAVGALMASLC